MNTLKLTEIVEAADKDFALALVPAETLEKFSLLIVHSILKRLEDEREYYANPVPYEPEDYYIKMAGKKDAIDDAIAMIRSDFGVK